MGDHRLHYNYDRVFAIGGDGKTGVIPDATCVIGDQRYFVEIDRGTRPLKTWATKTYAYEAYRNSEQLRARYGVDTFKVLIVTPNKTRLYRIATEVSTVTCCATKDYLFAQESIIHPMIIRKGWYILSSTTMRQKQVVKTTVSSADIQLKRCALWEHATDD
jgi:Replication-relaxation